MDPFVRPALHDRQQLAAHVEELVRTALEPPIPLCDSGYEEVSESPALPALERPTDNFFDSTAHFDHFIPCLFGHVNSAQQDLATPGAPPAPQRSGPVTSAMSVRCPSVRRRLSNGNGWRPGKLKKIRLSATLRIRQAALQWRRVLTIHKDGQHTGGVTCWLDDADPLAAVMRRWEHQLPAGWHGLMQQTLRKFLGAACSDARGATLKRLGFLCHGAVLCCFLPVGADPVLIGIARKAEKRSQSICSECGCEARRREMGEDGLATLCAPCAAPRLLEHDLRTLAQSIGFLRGVNAPVVAHQILALLRPSFCQAAVGHPEDDGPAGRGRMSPARFLVWAADWLAIGKRIFMIRPIPARA